MRKVSAGEKAMEIKRISPDEAKEQLDTDSDAVYLDVRTVPEFDAGHVPGAKNIPVLDRDPYGRMAPVPRFAEIVEANFGKDVKCITGCQKGARSMMAAEILVAAGFTNVVDMRGGWGGEVDMTGRMVYPGWVARGLPATAESEPQDRFETLATADEVG